MTYAIAAIIALGCLIIGTMEHFERKDCKDGGHGVECEQGEKS